MHTSPRRAKLPLNMYHDKLITGDDDPLATFKQLVSEPVGYSIARAARILGMTKQAVDKAIQKDALHATRIYINTDKGPKLLSIEVDRDSVHEYAGARHGRQRVPKGYLANQHPLPLEN